MVSLSLSLFLYQDIGDMCVYIYIDTVFPCIHVEVGIHVYIVADTFVFKRFGGTVGEPTKMFYVSGRNSTGTPSREIKQGNYCS